ncbi:MAG TPA: radical SAM protein [Polyangia bacterium]|jgi:hypothetical protein
MSTPASPLVRLVGLHRQLVDRDAVGSSLGGYVDTLSRQPYSLGCAYLKAACDAAPEVGGRCRIELCDLIDPSPPDAPGSTEEYRFADRDLARLLAGDPAAVCFSAYCWSFTAALEACRRIKEQRPEVLTVIGGRAVDEVAPIVVRDNPAVDHVVTGEAETSFTALLGRWLASGAAVRADLPSGTYGRDAAGTVIAGPPAAPVADLDAIPSPYLQGLVRPAAEGMMLELSRGCLNRCGYCSWSSAKERRRFAPERTAAELAWAVAHGVTHVTLLDSAINYEPDTVARFVAAARRADPGGALSYTYNLRYELITEDQVALLARLRARQVLLGLESLGDEALAQSDRARVDPARFERALGLLRALAPPDGPAPTVVGVVLGLPGDTLAGFRRTMDYLVALAAAAGSPLGAVLVSLLQVFPGTSLWRRRAELGIRLPARGIPYVVETGTFARADLKEALAFLGQLRLRHPLQIKRPEGAHALLDGDDAPARHDVGALLRPWGPGTGRAGWLFREATPLLDGEGIAVLRFERARGGEVRIRLDRRDDRRSCFVRTGRFNVYYHGQIPQSLRGAPLDTLMREVVQLISASEDAWAAAAGGGAPPEAT